MKISIIGAGNVGGCAALRIAQEELGDVFLLDIAPGLAKGKAYDLEDAVSLTGKPYRITGSEDMNSLADSDIVVITAGLARKPGMTREDLLAKNAAITGSVCRFISDKAKKAIVVIVTNPLDAMTWYAGKLLGFPSSRVFGMGLTLDSARFANLIGKTLGLPATQIDAPVIGAHGEGMLPLSRLSRVAGKPFNEIIPEADKRQTLEKRVIERGKEIVSLLGSGSAYFAPSAAICQMVKAIANDEKSPLAASCLLKGEYGISGICLGVPCIIGRNGVEKIIELDLNTAELKILKDSAEAIRQLNALIKI